MTRHITVYANRSKGCWRQGSWASLRQAEPVRFPRWLCQLLKELGLAGESGDSVLLVQISACRAAVPGTVVFVRPGDSG